MDALFPEDIIEKLGGTIEDIGVAPESGCGMNIAFDPDNLADAFEVAIDGLIDLGEGVDSAEAGRLVSLINLKIQAAFSGECHDPILPGELP